MSASVKWWHLAIGSGLFVLLCIALWRWNFALREPNISAKIPKGKNADNALKIDMDGGH